MEVVLGAMPSLLPKLGELLADEYNLQKEVKGGIRFLQAELESMKAALEDISKIPPDQLPIGDKIWARNVRELSYDIEDNIDTFMVQVKGHQPVKKHGFKKFIDKTLGSLMQPKIRRKIAVDIRDIKSRVVEVHDRHRRYEVNHNVDKSIKVDPLALVAMVRYKNPTELVGIEESRDEVIKIMMKSNEESKEQKKIVSIVGFGGLGKTTLANAVYEKLRAQFDCSAFVSVSQTPDMDRLFKDMFYQLANKDNTASANVIIDKLRGFLREKRYLVIIDDIWEISYWERIRCALPDDSIEYRIVTTTRIFTVAKEIGGPYKMKPLSLENSRILMYGRIFGKDEKENCPDELLEVSNRILKKCGGVPLAIIAIASLLTSKGRNKLEWFGVCNSIGARLEEGNTIENMRKVLSLSYYDMPSHLRACLLYLSMFPEDYDIRKDRLIWLSIAEGFIQSKKKDNSLFETGESYLNDLINRSMVQPKHDKFNGMIESCRVHDMVLDLICSLSSEENFVTIRNNRGHSSESKKVRRLSLQNSKAHHGKPEATLSKEHNVRSVIVFGSAIDYIPTVLENFSILRVLDLEGCDLSQSNSPKYLGNLLHLRYLGLRFTIIDELPEEIGNLQFLQMLDVMSSSCESLPSSIVGLTQLMSLRIDYGITVPEGIGSLIGLEELLTLSIDCNGNMLEELAHLTELKVLHLRITNHQRWGGPIAQRISGNSSEVRLHKSVVECLNKIQKIQSLTITIEDSRECNMDGWVVTAPENLRILRVRGFICWFATLPAWLKVNPSLLPSLSRLEIQVKRLQQEDLELLGRLPALHSLRLSVSLEDQGIHRRLFVVGACSFPCLVWCGLSGFGVPVVFQQGVMPRLTDLWFKFRVQGTREFNGSFDLGLGNLLSLQLVRVSFESGGASEQEVEEAKAAMRHAVEVHPNHPTTDIL